MAVGVLGSSNCGRLPHALHACAHEGNVRASTAAAKSHTPSQRDG